MDTLTPLAHPSRPLPSNAAQSAHQQPTPLAEATVSPSSGAVAATGQNQTVGATANAETSKPFEHQEPHRDTVDSAVKDINEFLQTLKRSLQFTLDDDSGQMVVQIKDTETDEVIRQIPSEQALEIAKQLGRLKGVLFTEQA